MVTLTLKIPRDTSITPEATETFLSALIGINKSSIWAKLAKNHRPIALEIVLARGQIYFQIVSHESLANFIEGQIQSSYPDISIQKSETLNINERFNVKRLILGKGSYYPIKNYHDFKDVDPLSSVLTVLSKATQNSVAIVQFCLEGVSQKWQTSGESYALQGTKRDDGNYTPRTDASVIREKIKLPGFKTSIRVAANDGELLSQINQSFNVFGRADGNSIIPKSSLRKRNLINKFNQRMVVDNQIFNTGELATLWHLPSDKIQTQSISWGNKSASEPPQDLPTSKSESERVNINFFAKTHFKNEDVTFGIKDIDRRRHIWAIGKTGSGKSTLIANMVIDDLKKNRGVAIIDPHGDLCEEILNFIPKDRQGDVVYFNPADKDFPISINPLEVTNKDEAELVVSGIISIFTKIWSNVWSARMEYILRNTLLTLAQVPDSTINDVITLLTNKDFRGRVVEQIDDLALKRYWVDEYGKMPEKLREEAISAILNKVGQFVTSPMIRKVIGTPKSSISLDAIMNEGKIILVNLSQGRLGEDNAALLGAMIITKLQLSAMRRVDIPEVDRRDFYLYVDEFQNFATNSFIKILSEARKYRLNLILANQYMAQIPIEVQKAILGNAGTIISFAIGAEDAHILQREFAEVFKEKDLVNLAKYQIAIKLMVDGQSQRPFLATTLPLPVSRNKNKQKVIKKSQEKWGRNLI